MNTCPAAVVEITDNLISNHLACPHRVRLDVRSTGARRDEVSPFVELLWNHGLANEAKMVAALGDSVCELGELPESQREAATLAAMRRGEAFIHGGLLRAEGLTAQPPVLVREGHGYIPAAFGSAAIDDDDDKGPSLPLPAGVIARLAQAAFILSVVGFRPATGVVLALSETGEQVRFDLDAPRGIRNQSSWRDLYAKTLSAVRAIAAGQTATLPALGATCKLCVWYSHCKAEVIERDDLSLIAECGRTKRDEMIAAFPTVRALANADPEAFVRGKKTVFAGIGPATLLKFHARARLLSSDNPRPYLKGSIHLPVAPIEVYFDIEADPMTDTVYLHGFVERDYGRPETARYIPFLAEGNDLASEKAVFAQAWEYLKARLVDSIVYFYSPYEKVSYKRLAKKFPDVCSVEQVEDVFQNPGMVDLYTDVVKKHTEWPTHDMSIKTIAVYLGFRWRDRCPSGAASIEWYQRWLETGDPAIRTRILEYNEDDNIATSYVADGVRRMIAAAELEAAA